MDASGVLPSHETPRSMSNGVASTEAVMTDVSSPPHPNFAQSPGLGASMPPPSLLEPPATEQRAQSQSTGPAVKGPKLPAMSPPVPGQNRQNGYTSSSGSPETRKDFQTADQYAALANLIKNSDQAVVRQVLRDHWQQCLVGSEYHTAFSLNTALHQATPATLNRAVLDFGGKMVASCKESILKHFTANDYDEVADTIFPNLSSRFLDRALALRVETIAAKSLVNVLGRAERLGYSVDDIVEEHPATNGIGKTEQVIPAMTGIPLNLENPPPQQHPPQYIPSQPQYQQNNHQHHQKSQHHKQGALGAQQVSLGLVQCGACKRPCTGLEALNYHSKKAACDPDFKYEHIDRSICPHCGCSFGSSGGCYYHLKAEVCGTFDKQATNAIHEALQEYVQNRPGWTRQSGSVTGTGTGTGTGTPTGGKKAAFQQTPSYQHKPSPQPSSSTPQAGGSPYDHLNAETLERFRKDMAEAEEIYGQKMRDAMLLPEPESTDKLSRHKNAYNAKISTTRKRYGIRLRERRAKEEVDAERIRLLRRPDAPEVWLEQERKARDLERSGKRPFDSGTGTPQASMPSQHPQFQPSQTLLESPRKRVPLAEMGGLSGSAGSAEVIDPTGSQAPSSQPRNFVQMQQQMRPAAQMSTPTQGTQGQPVAVDSTSNSDASAPGQEDDGSESETDSSDDDSDEDIPAA